MLFNEDFVKGAVRRKNRLSQFWILFRSTFRIKKNSLLTWLVSHLVRKIFWFKKNANEVPYDVIYSTNSVKEEYLRK